MGFSPVEIASIIVALIGFFGVVVGAVLPKFIDIIRETLSVTLKKVFLIGGLILFIIGLGIFITLYIPSVSTKNKSAQSEKKLNEECHQLFDIKTGKFSCTIDSKLTIEKVTYPLDNCSIRLKPPIPLDINELPVLFDNEENTWKIRTNHLVTTGAVNSSDLLHVPQKIEMTVDGLNNDDIVYLNVFTDQQYTHEINMTPIKGKVNILTTIGTIGFLAHSAEITEQNIRDAVLGRATFTQEELQELDLNKDSQIDVADLVYFVTHDMPNSELSSLAGLHVGILFRDNASLIDGQGEVFGQMPFALSITSEAPYSEAGRPISLPADLRTPISYGGTSAQANGVLPRPLRTRAISRLILKTQPSVS